MLSQQVIFHSQLIYDCFTKVTGYSLIDVKLSGQELASELYVAPFALLSHDAQPDPVFNYANVTAQKLWNQDWQQFVKMPSRLSAEPIAVAERQAMLEEAKRKGFISDYQGIRISSTGQRFIIKNAVLWNLYTKEGKYEGQAAMFKEWVFL
jgi:hypothetical protein